MCIITSKSNISVLFLKLEFVKPNRGSQRQKLSWMYTWLKNSINLDHIKITHKLKEKW